MAETKEKTSKASQAKRLYRSEKDRMIGGVCGGLGEYFQVDSSLFRLLFVVITLFGGAGILLYLVLWIILPRESFLTDTSEETIKKNTEEIKEKAEKVTSSLEKSTHKDESKMWWGLIIIIIGLLFLLDNFGFFRLFRVSVWHLWPVILIIIGVLMLGRRE